MISVCECALLQSYNYLQHGVIDVCNICNGTFFSTLMIGSLLASTGHKPNFMSSACHCVGSVWQILLPSGWDMVHSPLKWQCSYIRSVSTWVFRSHPTVDRDTLPANRVSDKMDCASFGCIHTRGTYGDIDHVRFVVSVVHMYRFLDHCNRVVQHCNVFWWQLVSSISQ